MKNPKWKRCALKSRMQAVKYKYGLEWDEFDALHKKCSGVCQICHKPLSMSADETMETAYVDHNHETGEVRGILCRVCNVGLGHLQDSKILLNNAIRYLDAYSRSD